MYFLYIKGVPERPEVCRRDELGETGSADPEKKVKKKRYSGCIFNINDGRMVGIAGR